MKIDVGIGNDVEPAGWHSISICIDFPAKSCNGPCAPHVELARTGAMNARTSTENGVRIL